MKRRLITSALPYVNNVPHLGNLIQVLSADCFARFCRLRSYETLYVCGTDEYGTATETRAAEEGISPRELCDRYHAIHADIYRWFNIAFDKFGRTSTPIQSEVTQGIFRKLDEAGYILERRLEQLHCGHCGRFLADRFIRGVCPHCGSSEARGDQCESCGKLLDPTELKEPKCSVCGSTPALKSTKHLYIDLPKIRPLLEEWIREASVKGFWANNAVRMTEAWIRDGLKERAITRDLRWGIPVPKAGFEDKVFYVWFDAPIGYISITGNLGDEITAALKNSSEHTTKLYADWRGFVDYWWKSPDDTELYQFIGKDNIPFHTVIFPSSLLGSSSNPKKPDWTMLHHMSSTEYLNYEGGKFSKSRGIGVFGTDVMETGIPADVWRFYIFYNRPEKADALFTWKDFQEKVNGELIGNLGNLVNRTLSFVIRYYGGLIPAEGRRDPAGSEHSIEQETKSSAFWERIRKYEEDIAALLEKAELRDAFRMIFELSSFANKSFQDGEPWRRRKGEAGDPEGPEAAAALIRSLCHAVRDIAVMIEPYMPSTAERIAGFFGLSFGKDLDIGKNSEDLSWKDLGAESGLKEVVKCEVLFSKLEEENIEALRLRYSGSQQEREAEPKEAEAPKPDAAEAGLKNSIEQKVKPPDSQAGPYPAPLGRFEPGKDLFVGGMDPHNIHTLQNDDTPPLCGGESHFSSTLDLRVAKIVRIERHPKADKLYIETLEIGNADGSFEERIIVSGLVPFYKEEELLGKHIIVAYNLKAAKLRGVESRGMLLAASDMNGAPGEDGKPAERCEVLDASGIPTGTRVVPEGMESGNPPDEIDIDTFFSVPMLVKDNTVTVGGKALCLNGKPVRTAIIGEGEVH
ncbi:MAG: methionine--tRNA ligase [Treponema sp.]|jgi:methionyl-tRNA synthetase|nr:methionine--tRNA ligase [Treponema sp.]